MSTQLHRPSDGARPLASAQPAHPSLGTAYAFVLPVLALTVIFSVLPLVLVFQRSLYRGNIFEGLTLGAVR